MPGAAAQALDLLRQALALQPDYPAAQAAAAHAVQAHPRFSLAHVLHAAALSSLGRIDDGRAALRRVIELEPQFTVARFVQAHTGRSDIWDPIGRALSDVMPQPASTPG